MPATAETIGHACVYQHGTENFSKSKWIVAMCLANTYVLQIWTKISQYL